MNYDLDGVTKQVEEEIDGSNETILFQPLGGGSLGDQPLGSVPLGDQPDESDQLPKFRKIIEAAKQDFFELQDIFQTDTQDYQWEILAFGVNVSLSKNQPTHLK